MRQDERILSHRSPAEFVGREAELTRIADHISAPGVDASLSVLAAPMAGTSELLRQAYDRSFREGSGPIPFYFAIRSDASPRALASRFLHEFLVQTVAFRRRDAGIIAAAPDICEVTQIAPPADGHWIDRLAETCEMRLSDDRSFIRSCLSAPVRAARHGAVSFVIVDGIHRLAGLPGGGELIDEMKEIYSRGPLRTIFAGHRRFVFERLPFISMPLEPLGVAESHMLVEKLSERHGVAVTAPSRDLIALELDGLPGHIYRMFAAAAEREIDLDTFDAVQQVYTDELFGGRIARCYDRIIRSAVPVPASQKALISVLNEAAGQPDGRVPLAYFQKKTGLAHTVIDELHCREVVDADAVAVRFETSNTVLTDYVRARARLESGEKRARVVGASLAAAVKRAPALMARSYRRGASIGIADLLETFDAQMVSLALFDYGRFRSELKGAGDEKIFKALREDNAKAALPRVVYVTSADSLYPDLASITESERAAVGIGLESDGREIAILAAEIDSKLEATRSAAEFWCDRLEAAAASNGLDNFKIWLIAPEGFDDDALEMLGQRGFYGSSRKQAALLAQFLNTTIRPEIRSVAIPPSEPQIQTSIGAPEHAEPGPPAEEYQMTVPMGDDTEILAARSVEDIARKHGIPQKTINQIKTALVEACINASEHSLSPDRQIDLKFAIVPGRLTITVANRGIRLADRPPLASDQERRGWGLKLMRSLMDEVRMEPTDDGTRLVMVKSLSAE
jgi:serine/threonine-protein kinase RsbW